MAGIFVSGHSGCGKTTFITRMSQTHGLTIVNEVIRNIFRRYPGFGNINFHDRQFVLEAEYLKVHQLETEFLSDRSVLDVMAWTGRDPQTVRYLGLENHKPSLFILVPVPSVTWFNQKMSYYAEDPIRLNAYIEKLGIDADEVSNEVLAGMMYTVSQSMYQSMLIMARNLDWPTFFPEVDTSDVENFQANWQASAGDRVVEVWKSLKASK